MVNKSRHYQEQIEPPQPMDESWWEAVLAQEDEQIESNLGRSARASAAVSHWDELRHDQLGEDEYLNWEQAFELYEQDQVIRLAVSGCNRGGLLVSGEHLHGFVPLSHLVEYPCQSEDPESWLATYLDRMLDLKVIECDRERGRVVFSERAAQSHPGSRNTLLTNLTPGNCAKGIVTNITDFGVFVDLGASKGWYVSEISWGRVQHPSGVVSLGQEVVVYVISVDPKRARVALSLKRLHKNPWETAEIRYVPGQIADAVITSIVPFGAFARLEEGLDGLIHVSEIASGDDPDALAGLFEGQPVRVRILHVDAPKQRLGLSLKLNDELVLS